MLRNVFAGVGLALSTVVQSSAAQKLVEPPRLLDDIKFLTDDRLQGRATGSAGADSAATYLARRFSARSEAMGFCRYPFDGSTSTAGVDR